MRRDISPPWRFITAAVLACVALGGAALGIRWVWISERAVLKSELAPYLVPPVTILGRTYQVRSGTVLAEGGTPSLLTELRVLRLARYAVLTRLDPLFALSGVDPARLRAAVEALEDASRALAEGGGWGSYRSRIRELYPLAILKILPELEELRRQVITAPDLETARRYQHLLERAGVAALDEARRYRENLRSADGERASTRRNGAAGDLLFLSTVTDAGIVAAAVDEIEIGMRQQRDAAMGRRGCLSLLRPCGGALAFAWQRMSPGERGDVSRAAIVPEVAELLDAYSRSQHVPMSDRVFWVATPCFGRSDLLYPFRISRQPREAVEALYPGWSSTGLGSVPDLQPLDAMYFYTIARGPAWVRSFWGEFTARGFPVFWQPPSIYTCPEMEHFARLLNYAKLVDAMRERPVFRIAAAPPGGISPPTFSELSEIEDRLVGDGPLSESDFADYLAGLSALFAAADEATLAGHLGEETVLMAEEFASQIFEQSGALDELLTASVFRAYNLLRFRTHAAVDDTASASAFRYQAVAAGLPSVHFLPFNPTFVGGARPQFIAERSMPANSPFVSLAELRSRHTREEVREIMGLRTAVFPPFPIR